MTYSKQTPKFLLVGGLLAGATDKTVPFIREMFGRFTEVKHTGNLTRQVQYASGAG